MDLIKQQTALQQEGFDLINELDLEQYLSQFGVLDIGGSIKTGLMTWRDIDIGVICTTLPTTDKMWHTARELAEKPHITRITVQDNMTDGKYYSAYPKGYYLGLVYDNKDIHWKVDIWFAENFGEHGSYDDLVISQLNDENKLIILQIKNALSDHPLYRKKIKSVDIYDAVLKQNVKDLEGFKKYIQETKSIDLS